MAGYNIIHLSDLHIGRSSRFPSKELSIFTASTLSADISRVAKEHNLDFSSLNTLLVVTGDITAQGEWWQYEAAMEFLELLQTRLHNSFQKDVLPSEHIFCIPGNHDIRIPEAPAVDTDADRLRREKYNNFRLFNELVTDYSLPSKDFSSEYPFLNGSFSLPMDFFLIDANSTYNLHAYRKGAPGSVPSISDDQVQKLGAILLRNGTGLRIAAMHHPLEILPTENTPDNRSSYSFRSWLIRQHVKILLTGHLHNPQGAKINPIDVRDGLLCLGTGFSFVHGEPIPGKEIGYEIIRIDPDTPVNTHVYLRSFSWQKVGELDPLRNFWGPAAENASFSYSIPGIAELPVAMDHKKYIGIPQTKDWMVIAHCDSKKFRDEGKASPGENIHSILVDLTGKRNRENLAIIPELADGTVDRRVNWDKFASKPLIFLLDSPHYNPYVDDVLKRYRTHLSGGMLQFVDEMVIPVKQYIQTDVNSPKLKSDKTDSPDVRLFDKYKDYLLVMRLPSFIPITASTNVDVLDVDKNRIMWVISGIHSKASYAGSELFRQENFLKFCDFIKAECGLPLPDFFEAVFEVPAEPETVTDFSLLKKRHFRKLRLKTEVGLSDELPSGVSSFFMRKKDHWKQIALHTVHFDPIAGCNYQCPHCIEIEERKNHRYLSLNTCLTIMNDLKDNGCQHLNFYGGEPTLHPEFPAILRSAVNMGFQILFVTNGSRLSDPSIRKSIIDGRKAIHLRVSLDAHSKETHDKNHRVSAGDYPTILESVDFLLQNGVSISLSYLLHRNIIRSLGRISNYWKARHASSVIFRPITKPNGEKPFLEYPEEEKEIIQKVIRHNSGFVHSYPWFLEALQAGRATTAEKTYPNCYSGYYRIAISPGNKGKSDRNFVVDGDDKNIITETNDAWISLCTYHRYDEKYGCDYPPDFSSWMQNERIVLLDRINPKEQCQNTICCRDSYNTQVFEILRNHPNRIVQDQSAS